MPLKIKAETLQVARPLSLQMHALVPHGRMTIARSFNRGWLAAKTSSPAGSAENVRGKTTNGLWSAYDRAIQMDNAFFHLACLIITLLHL